MITGRVVEAAGAGRSAARSSACWTRPTSSPPRSSPRPPVTSGSSPPRARGRCARCPGGQRRRQRGAVRRGHPRGRRQGRLTSALVHGSLSARGTRLPTMPCLGDLFTRRGAVLRDPAGRVPSWSSPGSRCTRCTASSPTSRDLRRRRPVAAAAERAKRPRPATSRSFEDLPLPADTANLREGANLNDACWRCCRWSACGAARARAAEPAATTGSASRSSSRTTAATT